MAGEPLEWGEAAPQTAPSEKRAPGQPAPQTAPS